MAESDGTTVNIDLCGVELANLLSDADYNGEGLVELEKGDVVDSEVGLRQSLGKGDSGRLREVDGLNTSVSPRDNLGERGQPKLLGLLSGHEDEGRCAIAQGGGVGRSDGTTSLEGRAERRNFLKDDPGIFLVLTDNGVSLLALDGDGDNLGVKSALLPCTSSALVRLNGMRVLGLTSDAMLLSSSLAAIAHGEVVVGIPKAVGLKGVAGSELAEWRVLARQEERGIAHALHSTSSNDRAVTKLDSLRSEHDGLHAASADLVDGGGIGAGLKTGTKGDLTSRRLADASLDDVSEVDLLNNGRVDVLGFECVLEGDDAKLGRVESLQRSIDRANGCARRRDNDNFVVGHGS